MRDITLYTEKGKLKAFQLELLEDAALDAYADFVESSNERTKTRLFTTIRDLAYAILCVGSRYKGKGLDASTIAYEYAVDVFTRISGGQLALNGHKDRFPLQRYMDLDIRTVLNRLNAEENKLNEISVVNIDDVIRDWDSDPPEDVTNPEFEYILDYNFALSLPADGHEWFSEVEDSKNRHVLKHKIYKAIRLFYSKEDVLRYTPLILNLMGQGGGVNIDPDKQPDLFRFWAILVSVSKRLSNEQSPFVLHKSKANDFKALFKSAIRSTIFLSLVSNNKKIKPELLLALDLDSLYRLANIAGGRRLLIPNVRDIDRLVSATSTLASMIIENRPYKECYEQTKKDLQISMQQHETGMFLNQLKQSFDVFHDETKTEPVMNIMASVIKSMESLSWRIENSLGSLESVDLLNNYLDLSQSFLKCMEALINLRSQYSITDFGKPTESPKS